MLESFQLQASWKQIPATDVVPTWQMTIPLGMEKTNEFNIQRSNDANLEMAIANFFHCKNVADHIVEST